MLRLGLAADGFSPELLDDIDALLDDDDGGCRQLVPDELGAELLLDEPPLPVPHSLAALRRALVRRIVDAEPVIPILVEAQAKGLDPLDLLDDAKAAMARTRAFWAARGRRGVS